MQRPSHTSACNLKRTLSASPFTKFLDVGERLFQTGGEGGHFQNSHQRFVNLVHAAASVLAIDWYH